MLRRVHRSVLSLVLIASQTLAPLPALAQSDEQRAAARELAGEGADAFDAGRYQDAIDRFTRAESLVHAAPHLLFLARSHAKLNQYVKAREAYMKIINEQLPPNATQGTKDAQAAAQTEITAVEGKIGRLTIQVQGREQTKDLVVQVNGVVVPSVLVGAPQPIDPGDYKVDAIATGFRAGPEPVSIGEGERKELVLKLASDPNAVPPGGVAAVAAAGQGPAPNQPDSPPVDQGVESEGTNGLRIGSYVAFGVGAVGLGVGTVFLLQSSSKRSEADDLCTLPNGGCDLSVAKEVKALDADANSAGTIGIIGIAAGAAGVATGVVLFVLSGSSDEKAASVTRPRVEPFVGKNTFGVRGTF
jgi:hypothetical protein